MTDPRLTKLANSLVNYSCKVKTGENVLIEIFDCEDVVAEELCKAVTSAGGNPFVNTIRSKVHRAWLANANRAQIEAQTKWDMARMGDMQAYIAFRGNDNAFENAGVSEENLHLYRSIYSHSVHTELRVKKTKWVVLRYPTSSMAQLSSMSTRDFEDFYFDVCNLDYAKMSAAMDPLCAYLDRTDKVRLVAKDTDISFSIKDIKSVKCDGERNVPDGEVYTAPVRNSANGRITFNTPSQYQGFTFERISFVLENGKIVKAEGNDTARLNRILDTDEGSRYIGEFAIGVNPYITRPMNDTLFDEKISGSIHFTPGSAYEEADNGNKSAVHWDLVLIMTPEWGGGEVWFDDVLVRKDGRFIVSELECLNPENLS